MAMRACGTRSFELQRARMSGEMPRIDEASDGFAFCYFLGCRLHVLQLALGHHARAARGFWDAFWFARGVMIREIKQSRAWRLELGSRLSGETSVHSRSGTKGIV